MHCFPYCLQPFDVILILVVIIFNSLGLHRDAITVQLVTFGEVMLSWFFIFLNSTALGFMPLALLYCLVYGLGSYIFYLKSLLCSNGT